MFLLVPFTPEKIKCENAKFPQIISNNITQIRYLNPMTHNPHTFQTLNDNYNAINKIHVKFQSNNTKYHLGFLFGICAFFRRKRAPIFQPTWILQRYYQICTCFTQKNGSIKTKYSKYQKFLLLCVCCFVWNAQSAIRIRNLKIICAKSSNLPYPIKRNKLVSQDALLLGLQYCCFKWLAGFVWTLKSTLTLASFWIFCKLTQYCCSFLREN